MKKIFLVVLASLPLVLNAQLEVPANAHLELQKAISQKRHEDALAICDRILNGDVMPYLLLDEGRSLPAVFRVLAQAGTLGLRIDDWEMAWETSPKSERLNFLLAEAYSFLEAGNASGTRTMGILAPGRLRVRRESHRFASEIFNPHSGEWEVLRSHVISMPRKVLAGLVVSSGTARLNMPVLSVAGEPASLHPWKTAQIGRSVSRAKLTEIAGGISISGAGFPLSGRPNDDVFFAWQEIEGDFVLEVTVEELLGGKSLASAGLAIRSSLDPAAPFLSVAYWTDGLAQYHRERPGRAAKYWKALSECRPGDPAFAEACLRKMNLQSMNGTAEVLADRLLASGADPAAFDEGLFAQIYWRAGRESPLHRLRLERVAPENRDERAIALLEEARRLQGQDRQEEAVSAWKQARAILPGETLPMADHRQLLISLRRLGRTGEHKTELKRFFLGGAGSPSDSPSQRILSRVEVSTPCLVPAFFPVFEEAASAGLAKEIARELEKVAGPAGPKNAAQSVGATLRIAALDPGALPNGKNSRLPEFLTSLPPRGLALAAFQLQQTLAGRPWASKCLAHLLETSRGETQGLSAEALLAWKLRLDEMLGDREAVRQVLQRLAIAFSIRDHKDGSQIPPTVRRLLLAGDLAAAEKLAQGLSGSSSPFDPAGDVLEALAVAKGRSMPMPIVWSRPDGENIRIFWELAPDNWGQQPSREVRPMGRRQPVAEGRYVLDIYAERGSHYGDDFGRENLLISIPVTESAGEWTGKFPADRSWIAAVLREKNGVQKRSPSVPAAVGMNLLEVFDGDKLKDGTGAWSTPVKWYWSSPLPLDFPENAWLVSRLQHDMGRITIDHRPVSIDPQAEYTFSGWLRTDRKDALLGVLFFNADGRQVGEFYEETTIGDRWTLVAARFGPRNTGGMVRIPPLAVTALVRLSVSTQGCLGDLGFYKVDSSGY